MSQTGGKPKVSKAPKKTSSSSTKRHFTVVIDSKEHGLYVSSSPSSAARKAVSKLCASNKSKKVEFSIREITQGSKKKTYGPYLGEIEKLAKPIELKGRVIKYKPVAKLSGKSSKKSVVKKGGMRGGANRLDRDKPLLFNMYPVGPVNNVHFVPPGLLIQYYIDNGSLIDRTKTKINHEKKSIEFNFRNDLSDRDILKALYSDDNKKYVSDLLETNFHFEPGEIIIFLTIPYITENEEQTTYNYMWLNPIKENKYFSSNKRDLGINMLDIPFRGSNT